MKTLLLLLSITIFSCASNSAKSDCGELLDDVGTIMLVEQSTAANILIVGNYTYTIYSEAYHNKYKSVQEGDKICIDYDDIIFKQPTQ